MNILELIERKKSGGDLSRAMIDYFVQGVVDLSIPDYQIAALLMAIRLKGMTREETSYLTYAMAHSGDAICYHDNALAFDKHSTGGVGDSVTFIFLPVMASLGYRVGKMSGKGLGLTGGTIDKLSAIPGINLYLDKADFMRQIESAGGAITAQTEGVCPADKRLYALRDVTATVDSMPLIAASVMSKKIAGGAGNVVLDVKCGAGAFMKNADDARKLGDMMADIGRINGVNTAYIVSDMDNPLGDYIGNSLELYGAIEVLKGKKNRLSLLSCALVDKALSLVGIKDGKAIAERALSDGSAYRKFKEIILLQGGDISVIEDPEKLINTRFRKVIRSEKAGFISRIDAEIVARVVFLMGGGRVNKEDNPDVSVGVRLIKSVGDYVRQGEEIAELFYNDESHAYLADEITEGYGFSNERTDNRLIL